MGNAEPCSVQAMDLTSATFSTSIDELVSLQDGANAQTLLLNSFCQSLNVAGQGQSTKQADPHTVRHPCSDNHLKVKASQRPSWPGEELRACLLGIRLPFAVQALTRKKLTREAVSGQIGLTVLCQGSTATARRLQSLRMSRDISRLKKAMPHFAIVSGCALTAS